jgi:hypothetical protein
MTRPLRRVVSLAVGSPSQMASARRRRSWHECGSVNETDGCRADAWGFHLLRPVNPMRPVLELFLGNPIQLIDVLLAHAPCFQNLACAAKGEGNVFRHITGHHSVFPLRRPHAHGTNNAPLRDVHKAGRGHVLLVPCRAEEVFSEDLAALNEDLKGGIDRRTFVRAVIADHYTGGVLPLDPSPGVHIVVRMPHDLDVAAKTSDHRPCVYVVKHDLVVVCSQDPMGLLAVLSSSESVNQERPETLDAIPV